VKFLRSKRGVAVVAIVLLGLFLVRPGADRLRTRIVHSISSALGLPVDVASVHLRFLPQPGFDLENLVVHDDPAFSAEPLLRSEDVTATLRVTSLLRGRLEVARLSLTDPSINLVRDGQGQWNLESLLRRTASTSVAPTSKDKRETRAAFPYIEASHSRVNFKSGLEKKPYSLTDTDFAVWQDSENAWGMRLRGQALRTDFNLTDTGTITIEGSWQRAANLADTPLQFSFQWERAQLGQFTKLLYGNDKGWRGSLKLSGTLSGTPANLAVETSALIQGFRRYDVLAETDFQLFAGCSGRYSTATRTFTEIACQSPVSGGTISLKGSMAASAEGSYNLTLHLRQLPMQALAALAQHAKKDIPDDLVATGTLDANATLSRTVEAHRLHVRWDGAGEIAGLRLRSDLTNTDVTLGRVPLALASAANNRKELSQVPRVEIGPVNLSMGRPAATVAQGWFSRAGYSFQLQGDAQVKRVLLAARTAGLSTPQLPADGQARLNLEIAGGWAQFAAPIVTGNVQLHSVRAQVRGMSAPLEIAAASLILKEDETDVRELAASIAGSRLRGSLIMPRPCNPPDKCAIRFDLHADEIATDQWNQLLNPILRKQPWYRFLASAPAQGAPYLLTLRATGKITADHVSVHKLIGTRVSANVELDSGTLRISDLKGDVLGGRHTGDWKADFTTKPPQYSGSGTVEGVSLSQLSEAMKDGWVSGTGRATYRATSHGLTAADLFSTASGTLLVEAWDGSLPHIELAGTPVHMQHFSSRLVLHDGELEFQEGRLRTPDGTYQVSGTASLGRNLKIRLTREGVRGFDITGPLSEPHIAIASSQEAQAALR